MVKFDTRVDHQREEAPWAVSWVGASLKGGVRGLWFGIMTWKGEITSSRGMLQSSGSISGVHREVVDG